MTEHGFKTFTGRLRGLHDACGHKPPGDLGMVVWWDTLKHVAEHEVLGAIDQWTRTQPKPPAPSDIYKLACTHATDLREQAWDEQKSEFSKPWIGGTGVGRKALDEMLVMLKHRRAPGPWWADKIRERIANGERLPYASIVLAGEVLPEREPGEEG